MPEPFEGALPNEVEPVATVMHGRVRDQAELHARLDRIQALGPSWSKFGAFVWTKTADQIRESIARYCTRINDSRH